MRVKTHIVEVILNEEEEEMVESYRVAMDKLLKQTGGLQEEEVFTFNEALQTLIREALIKPGVSSLVNEGREIDSRLREEGKSEV